MQILSPGTRIGQYEIVSLPMMGGMGVVYFALDHGNNGRPVALKTFRPELLPDRAARDRFLREGSFWVELGYHPHIVTCYQVITANVGNETFLVLELVTAEPGRRDASLRSWLIPTQPLPLLQSLSFVIQIARGMHQASHAIPGFTHRDLKPENVLVGVDKLSNWIFNRVRVTDFGLAALAEALYSQPEAPPDVDNYSSLKRTQLTNGVVGTPLYMAPEQWLGQTLGIFTDIYALGCILLEMLCGSSPVTGTTISEVRIQHCSGKLHPIPKEFPDNVQMLLKKCLALSSKQRFQTWDEFLVHLCTAYQEISGMMVPEALDEQVLNQGQGAAGWSYSSIGRSYFNLSKFDISAKYFERALEIGKEQQERDLQASALGNLGTIYYILGQYQRAIEYHEENLEIARTTGYQKSESKALSNLGLAYWKLGEHQHAIGYFEESLKIARAIFDLECEANAVGNIGIVYNQMGQYLEAIDFLEQHLKLANYLDDKTGEANSQMQLGIAYIGLGQYQLSIDFLEQSKKLALSISNQRVESDAIANLGAVSYRLGQYDRAIEYWEQSLKIKLATGDQQSQPDLYFNLALLYAKQSKTAHAIQLAEHAATLYSTMGLQEQVNRTQRLLAKIQDTLSSDSPTPDS